MNDFCLFGADGNSLHRSVFDMFRMDRWQVQVMPGLMVCMDPRIDGDGAILLAILRNADGPLSHYELVKRYAKSELGNLNRVTLARRMLALKSCGWVSDSQSNSGRREHAFSITAAGRRILEEWAIAVKRVYGEAMNEKRLRGEIERDTEGDTFPEAAPE